MNIDAFPQRALVPPGSLERKPQLYADLPIRNLPTLDMSSRVGHAKPAQIVNGLARLLDRDANRVVRARGRASRDLDGLVHVSFAHGDASGCWGGYHRNRVHLVAALIALYPPA